MILTQALAPRARTRLSVFPAGQFSTNPSMLRLDDGYLCVVKGVNFDFEQIRLSGDWQAMDPSERIACAYRVVHLSPDLSETAGFELDTSAVERAAGKPVGVEDIRLFWLNGAIMACGCVVDRDFVWTGRRWITGAPTTRVFAAELALDQLENVTIFASPVGADQEKNWAPVCGGDELAFVVNIAEGGHLSCGKGACSGSWRGSKDETLRWRGGWSGSSCLEPWEAGYLAVIHRKSRERPACYWHMLALFDRDLRVQRRSDPFSFEGRPVEFCCGLDAGPDIVTFSYGLMDKYAGIAGFARQDIAGLLRHDVAAGDLQRIRSGGI